MFKVRVPALFGALLLAGCVSKPAPPPAPAPVAPPPPPPAPAIVAPPPVDWRDAPLTAGEWQYGSGSSVARYGAADGGSAFLLRCDPAAARIELVREGADQALTMTIRTSAGMRVFASSRADLPASDPFLDAIVFSRGRFMVEAQGQPAMIVPAWPEPAKVVEDCRS